MNVRMPEVSSRPLRFLGITTAAVVGALVGLFLALCLVVTVMELLV